MSLTNIALNSRSMNGQIVISDGVAVLSEGDLDCQDINSDSLTTNQINTTLLTVTGEFRCNLNGPLSIPTSISSLTGLLISYGNVTNSGATDFTNFGSTYTSTQQGFRFFNKSNVQTLTNLAIIDNTQTFFSSPLTGCLAESPVSANSVANRSYVDNNFVDRTNNLTQNINGDKTFTNSNLTIFNIASPSLYIRTSLTGTAFSYIQFTGTTFAINNQNPSGTIVFQTNTSTRVTINSTQLLLSSTTFLTTNDMKSRAPADPHSLLSDITTGSLVISSSTASNTINGATQTNQQITFNNFTPICSVATPTANNHLVRKDYVDNNFVNLSTAQNIYGNKYFGSRVQLYGGIALDVGPGTSTFAGVVSFNAQIYFVNLTPICYINPTDANHLTRKEYVDTNFMFKTNNVVENINGVKTFTNRINCNGTTSLVVAGIAQFDGTATFSSTLTSNNITAPIVLGGTNNIFTNLDTFTGGAIINIGAKNNNINVKCNLNINESAYLTGSQNTLIWMEGNNSRFENQNSTGGTYIFTIVESGTFNPLVINKTSVDIAGNANIEGNLILYDTTPSTLSMSVGVLGNNMTFDPENTLNTTYNFKVNDSSGTSTTTPLIISTASTTVANTLVCNSQATFNNGATFNSVIPTTTITASSANQLVNYSTLTTQGYTTLSAVQSNSNTFTATNTFTGNLVSTSAIIVRASLAIENGTKQMQSYLTATGELTFQPFFVSNSYKFQCLNATNTADKSIFFTFNKTTIQMELEVVENATFNSTASFLGDVTLSKTKNNSTYATYSGLNNSYIGYLTEVPTGIYLSLSSNTQYQVGAITLDSTNVGFWTCNYEVEINCATAGSITKIYVFISDNNVSTTIPITLPGAKANDFSTQTYTAGDSTYHSGSFSFLQSTTQVIYGLQVKVIISSGTFERKGQIRMLRIL